MQNSVKTNWSVEGEVSLLFCAQLATPKIAVVSGLYARAVALTVPEKSPQAEEEEEEDEEELVGEEVEEGDGLFC